MWTVAATSATAPMLGCLAALDAILGSFVGGSWELWSWYGFVLGRLSVALVLTAIGTLAGLVAWLIHRYIDSTVAAVQRELEIAILGLPHTARIR
jgi:biopolymer transport protein ExbB/TolQ